MEQSVVIKIINWVSNNFEFLIYVSGSLLAVSLLVYIAVKLRFVEVKKLLYSTFREALLMVVIVGQFGLFAIMGYFYWVNYQKPIPELKLSDKMTSFPHWVEDDLRVYFIYENTLRSIQVDGRKHENVFRADFPIRQYHFSPDGTHILIVTEKDLFLLNKETKQHYLIDSVWKSDFQVSKADDNVIKGSITGVRWSADSEKFVYEIARWSKFSAQDVVYTYTLKDRQKRSIQSPARRISSLYWDRESENLYYLQRELEDVLLSSGTFSVKVFRIALDEMVPRFILELPFEQRKVPVANLNLRGIHLFTEGDQFSFGLGSQGRHFISDQGSVIGIDDQDYLYFVRLKWFRRRLFKIPRELRETDMPRYQYRGGDLVLSHLRWIPGGQYVIMEHKHLGVIILEPTTGRTGILIQTSGHSFGWYQEPEA